MSERGSFEVRETDGVVIFQVGNYLNNISGEKIEEEVEHYLRRGYRHFLINFEKTKIINSIGVSFLIGVMERLKQEGATLNFSNLSRIQREIFEITGLARYVNIFPTEADAISAIKGVD
ncbi:MAG: STAS domain-containing protein [Candidatus Aenigmatarchaeota archaeon]